MKTNFFQQIADLGFKGNFLLNINQNEAGEQTVSVALKKESVAGKAGSDLPPMLFQGKAEELDELFFEKLAEPVTKTIGLFNNIEAYQKELDKAKKNVKPDKTKTNKTSDTTDVEDDDDKDDDNNLFNQQEDDKQAKAEKKRLYDEAMEKVKVLAQSTKYAEALANLPDVADYPDKAEAIEIKRKALEQSKAMYDKLAEQFKD